MVLLALVWATREAARPGGSAPNVTLIELTDDESLPGLVRPGVEGAAAPAATPRDTGGVRRAGPRRSPVAGQPGAPVGPVVAQPGQVGPGGAATGGGGGEGGTVAERLAPRAGDARLWRPGPMLPPSEEQVMRERVHARIEALNDSIRMAIEAEEGARDWTFKDKEGRLWGAKDGKIYVGGVPLPVPITLQPPNGRRDELRERERKDAEIRDHADRARIRKRFDDRVKAIRERKDRERAEKKKASGN